MCVGTGESCQIFSGDGRQLRSEDAMKRGMEFEMVRLDTARIPIHYKSRDSVIY
jgi:hypothetical protein